MTLKEAIEDYKLAVWRVHEDSTDDEAWEALDEARVACDVAWLNELYAQSPTLG